MKNQVKIPEYDRKKVKPGILHIGVGNFHRAHLEAYLDSLFSVDSTQNNWGVSGVMLMPGDKHNYEALKNQDGKYTLTICGRDGKDEAREIDSLVELNWSGDNPQAILERMADPDIRIISMTITEGGYNIDRTTGEFDLKNPNVVADLENPQLPATVFGYIAEGLRRRKNANAGPVTILTCDNLQHNGDTAKKAFMSFIKAQDQELADWVSKNVTFPNSMVDRITPATHPDDITRLNKKNGADDQAPVYCEDFIQWVVEDKFANGRPKWEEVGVEMTDDVSAYENMKLSLLNAAHSLLSYPAFLMGYRKVDEAMKDEDIRKFTRAYMDLDATPYVPAPGKTNLDDYKTTLIERFGNPAVSDQVARLCMDGLSKFPVYVIPVLAKMLADDHDPVRIAFLLAAYRKYLRAGVDDNGDSYEIVEPWLNEEDRKLIDSDNPLDFLKLPAFAAAPLESSKKFQDLYLEMVKGIDKNGVKKTLRSILSK